MRVDARNVVNHRSLVRFQSPAPNCEATGAEPIIRTSELRGFEGDVCQVGVSGGRFRKCGATLARISLQ